MDYISPNYNTGGPEGSAEDACGGDNPPQDAQNLYTDSGAQDCQYGSTDAENSPTPSHPSSTSSLSQQPTNFSASLPPINVFFQPPKKRRTGAIVAVCIAVALLLCLLTAAVVTLVLTNNTPAVTKPAETTPAPDVSETPDTAVPEQSAPVYVKPADENVSMEIDEIPASTGALAEGQLSFADIYAGCIDSVVSITSTSSTAITMGTGIVMSENGYIITNNHVIEGGSAITVTLHNNDEYTASLVGADSISDLAVLKIDASGIQPAEFGDSASLRVGDEVVAIGNPTTSEELRGTMTDGIISAIDRNLTVDGNMMTLIQTNAALNSGNSGGPLINRYGQVVGINIMKFASSYSSFEGLGFAIPISVAKPIIDELINNGAVSGRPSIGIMASDLPAAAAAYYGTPVGVLVESVDERAPAAGSGIQAGDIIVKINGEDITTRAELMAIKNECAVGDTITVTVYREGGYFDFEIELVDAADLN